MTTSSSYIDQIQHQKVLICPLNWGLGHATRCVPIIRELIKNNNNVVIATDGYPLILLRQEFPKLQFIELSSYPIQYSKTKSQVFAIVKSIPTILYGIYKEHKWLDKILKTKHFDTVISDNRFGLFSKHVHSVYITHQLMIKMPVSCKFLEPIAWLIHRKFIHKYDKCLIPDYENAENLSGDLSHKYKLPTNSVFIGNLSRFEKIKPDMDVKRFSVVVIVSGPEPQRSIFETEMIEKYRHTPTETLLISGKPSQEQTQTKVGFITIINHVSNEQFAAHLIKAEKIISRSGYSTIMDLHTLNCLHKAEFHPTPGQTEQEYLAKYSNKKGFTF